MSSKQQRRLRMRLRKDSNISVNDARLNEIQGNILEGHGRNHARYIFLTFAKNKSAEIVHWINTAVSPSVTSAAAQEKEKANKKNIFVSFMLTAKGYNAIGASKLKIRHEFRSKHGSFFHGLKNANINDPAVDDWEEGYQNTIHALVLLAHDDTSLLDKFMLDTLCINQDNRGVFHIDNDIVVSVHVEKGDVITHNFGNGPLPIEHFGFVDGISQPTFFKDNPTENKSHNHWDSSAPLNLVLAKDHFAKGQSGSYFVFRKLEQDVAGFRAEEEKIAGKLKVDPELIGAYAVGRFRDGTPVVDHGEMANPAPDLLSINNDFNYDDDKQAVRCPLHAHVRKTNPRLELAHLGARAGDSFLGKVIAVASGIAVTEKAERDHRIARRGITYGKKFDEKIKDDGESRGLFFQCYQGDISNQFKFQQKTWSNEPNFVRRGTGIDPIIGQGERSKVLPKWPIEYGNESRGTETLPFAQFVTMKGGEYFFAPSMHFINNMANCMGIAEEVRKVAGSTTTSSSKRKTRDREGLGVATTVSKRMRT